MSGIQNGKQTGSVLNPANQEPQDFSALFLYPNFSELKPCTHCMLCTEKSVCPVGQLQEIADAEAFRQEHRKKKKKKERGCISSNRNTEAFRSKDKGPSKPKTYGKKPYHHRTEKKSVCDPINGNSEQTDTTVISQDTSFSTVTLLLFGRSHYPLVLTLLCAHLVNDLHFTSASVARMLESSSIQIQGLDLQDTGIPSVSTISRWAKLWKDKVESKLDLSGLFSPELIDLVARCQRGHHTQESDQLQMPSDHDDRVKSLTVTDGSNPFGQDESAKVWSFFDLPYGDLDLDSPVLESCSDVYRFFMLLIAHFGSFRILRIERRAGKPLTIREEA